jgi:phosphopantetheine adenylyltransferase/dephospho-CoA kinase
MTFRTGLFIGRSTKNIGNFLTQCSQNETLDTLYIKLLSEKKSELLVPQQISSVHNHPNVFRQTVMNCYQSFQNENSGIDVRILLTNAKDPEWLKVKTSKPIEIVYFDSTFTSSAIDAFVCDHVTNKSENCRIVPCPKVDEEYNFAFLESDKDEFKYYDSVVLGGTFDKIHIGHKILFSEAIIRCRKRLTVGVTCDEMLKSML